MVEAIDWLLEEDAPGVELLTRTRLLGESSTSRRARLLRRRCNQLDHIESKRRPDGCWKMEMSLNGKMLAKVEKKGAPSKWITLQALIVLQHFGRQAPPG